MTELLDSSPLMDGFVRTMWRWRGIGAEQRHLSRTGLARLWTTRTCLPQLRLPKWVHIYYAAVFLTICLF
ncbi:unnamed protein product [Symbiodinium pilosum]|uniref:Uncharacterized protein n=1 Tax=Symbiodinium pilosum TaxID=2952 RepID=A0A812R016_SYMPI|nr:unnamed protein product [Symbiodinium pilosum]